MYERKEKSLNVKNKKILITGGGTTEFIDDVRVMTNTGTGTLASIIAQDLLVKGVKELFYVHGIHAEIPTHEAVFFRHFPVVSAQDAMNTIKQIMKLNKIDAVIHSMAVSDFTFKRSKNIKCKSNDPQGFIEYMQKTIRRNPKIISQIKKWSPKTFLVGFKYEVGLTRSQLYNLAQSKIINDIE